VKKFIAIVGALLFLSLPVFAQNKPSVVADQRIHYEKIAKLEQRVVYLERKESNEIWWFAGGVALGAAMSIGLFYLASSIIGDIFDQPLIPDDMDMNIKTK